MSDATAGGLRARVGAAYRLERYDQVEELTAIALAAAPDDAELMALRATAMTHRDLDGPEKKEVRRLLRAAVAAAPDDPWVLRAAAHTWVRLGDRSVAVELLERAIVLDPNAEEAHAMLGDQLLHKARRLFRAADAKTVARADEHAQIVMRLAPHDASGFLLASKVRLVRGDLDGCRTYAETALRLDPEHPVGHQLLGRAAQVDGDLEGASERYLTAGRLDPSSDTSINWMRTLRARGPIGALAGFLVFRLVLGLTRAAGASDGMALAVAVVGCLVLFFAHRSWSRRRARRAMAPAAQAVLAADRQTRRGRSRRR